MHVPRFTFALEKLVFYHGSLRHTEISFTNGFVVFRLYYLSGANQSMSLMPHVALVWCCWRQPGMNGKWVSTISYCLRIKHHMPHTWPSMLFCSETERTPVTFQTGHCTAQHRRVNASMNWYMYIYRYDQCQMAEGTCPGGTRIYYCRRARMVVVV